MWAPRWAGWDRWRVLVVGVKGAAARDLARVGACADELHLMRVERDGVPTDVGRDEGGKGSLSRKASRACGPSAIERM